MERTEKKNKKYSGEYKINVILDMRENKLGYGETVRKYWGENVNDDNYRKCLKSWERIYLEEGAQGLMEERRGKLTQGGKKRGRPPKPDRQVEENLITENQRLRMENEYLKKLVALVQSEEENESGTKRK